MWTVGNPRGCLRPNLYIIMRSQALHAHRHARVSHPVTWWFFSDQNLTYQTPDSHQTTGGWAPGQSVPSGSRAPGLPHQTSHPTISVSPSSGLALPDQSYFPRLPGKTLLSPQRVFENVLCEGHVSCSSSHAVCAAWAPSAFRHLPRLSPPRTRNLKSKALSLA